MNSRTERPLNRRTLPISLLILAADQSFTGVFMYMIAWSLIFSTLCIFGSMTIAKWLLLSVLTSICIFAAAIHCSFPAKCGWNNIQVMRMLLGNKEQIRRLSGKTLIHRSEGWEYSDSEWFIRISKTSSCILFAPELNFSLSGIHTIHTVYDDFFHRRTDAESTEYDRYTFTTQTRSAITIQIDRTDSLLKWIKEHGGHTVFKKQF